MERRQTLAQRTLARALEIVGAPERLAKVLNVSQARLELWFRGDSVPATDRFLIAVDIVVGDNAKAIDSDRTDRAIEGGARLRHPLAR